MLSALLVSLILTQGQPKIPTEINQFAFWLGKWKCNGTLYLGKPPKEVTTPGENEVTTDMDGFVIHEHFRSGPTRGESWSSYNPSQKKWHQTWVDNQGGYLALTGEFKNGKMVLNRPASPKNPATYFHMVYSKITKDSFDWDWEQTQDGGKTWTPSWHLHYTRVD